MLKWMYFRKLSLLERRACCVCWALDFVIKHNNNWFNCTRLTLLLLHTVAANHWARHFSTLFHPTLPVYVTLLLGTERFPQFAHLPLARHDALIAQPLTHTTSHFSIFILADFTANNNWVTSVDDRKIKVNRLVVQKVSFSLSFILYLFLFPSVLFVVALCWLSFPSL